LVAIIPEKGSLPLMNSEENKKPLELKGEMKRNNSLHYTWDWKIQSHRHYVSSHKNII
jgi:hypothetical protein